MQLLLLLFRLTIHLNNVLVDLWQFCTSEALKILLFHQLSLFDESCTRIFGKVSELRGVGEAEHSGAFEFGFCNGVGGD